MAARSVRLVGWMRMRPARRPVEAELATLRAELVRLEDAARRQSYETLLDGAVDKTPEYQEHIARYVRGRLELSGGPDQYVFPLLGLITTVIGLPLVIAGFWWVSTFTNWWFRPFGVEVGLFYAVIFAGTAGGVLRVLYDMVRQTRSGESEMQLYFEGLTHPLIGMILATALMMAFNSKFIATPVPAPDDRVLTTSGWTQAQMFMVFAGFAAGIFEDRALQIIGRVIPGRKEEEDKTKEPAAGDVPVSADLEPATASVIVQPATPPAS